MQIIAHIALLDVDSRVLLDCPSDDRYDMPGVTCDNSPTAALVEYVQRTYHITTFVKALFPLSFCTASDNSLHIVYGCRNWVGANGLQHVQGDSVAWIKPARLLDQAVTDTCKDLAPVLMSLLG